MTPESPFYMITGWSFAVAFILLAATGAIVEIMKRRRK